MLIKLLPVFLLTLALTECAKLRKTPKVYNALITTDENLQPSKAYPIIQPVIQPAIPVLSPIYPVYSQYLTNDHKNENQQADRKLDDVEVTNNGNSENNENHQPGTEKPNSEALPLNEFGLPPSLIPLQKFPSYPYNLPFYVDSYGNYQTLQYPVLPPINFYNQDQEHEHQLPPIEDAMFEVRPDNSRSVKSPKEERTTTQPNEQPSNDSFKNNANKNSEIPDIIPDLPYHIKKN
ncbi:hypothetical protein ACKWTF_010659 [Chironomus riparius]